MDDAWMERSRLAKIATTQRAKRYEFQDLPVKR